MAKLHIKKGDNVMVIAGNDKGRSGKVLEVILNPMLIIPTVELLKKKLPFTFLT